MCNLKLQEDLLVLWISHRGNINGKQPDRENHPVYIFEALAQGYWCEIDVWLTDSGIQLGHDLPQYPVNENMLRMERLVCHAKNPQALAHMLAMEDVHCFWHDSDDYTLTSRNWIWAYPGKAAIGNNSYIALPEIHQQDISGFAGVCSDVIEQYRND